MIKKQLYKASYFSAYGADAQCCIILPFQGCFCKKSR